MILERHVDPNVLNFSRFLNAGAKMAPIDAFPFLRYIMRRTVTESRQATEHLLSLLRAKIAETLATTATDDVVSFVSRFCEIEGPEYDRQELLFVVRDLVLAGSETSSTTLRWALVLAANHPDIQRRMQEELDSVVGGRPEEARLASLDDRPRLPLVEAFILELMRFKTIVPISVPHETLRDTEVGGYLIPAKTLVRND